MSRFRSLSLPIVALGVVASASAQEPPLIQPQTPPGTQRPGAVQPPQPGAQPNAEQVKNDVPLAETLITNDITEPKLTGADLAMLYRKYTGHRVIVSSTAAQAEFAFVQEASPSDPLTFAEAASLLQKAAILEGFVFVPDPVDPNLETLTYGTAAKPIAAPVYNEGDTLPDGDTIISYVMHFQYLKPDSVQQVFQNVLGQYSAVGTVSAVANASAVIITEKTSLIRRLIDLKAEIDKPSSQISSRFFDVRFADVTELAETLNTLLTTQQSTQRSAGIQRSGNAQQAVNGAPAGAIPQVAGQSSGGGEESPPQIIADARTNRIFAMGRPVDLLFIEGLVRQFDTETDQRNFLRRKLKFLTVADFLPVAENALNRAFGSTDDASATGGASGSGTAGSTTSSARNGTSSSTNSNVSLGGGTSGSSGSGSSGSGTSLSDLDIPTAPTPLLVGRTLLVADNITNSLVVQGPPSGVEIIEKLLDELDVKEDQVMISCVFAQLNATDGYSFGVDYSKTLGGSSYAVRGGSGSGASFTTDTLGINTDALSPNNGLSAYGMIGNNLEIYLNAKQNDSNFKVLSRPTIFTSNNKRGAILSGTQIAIPTNSYTTGTSASSSTNFEYKDVALKLEVVPSINSEDNIKMQIYLTSDDVGNDRQVGTDDNSYFIPDILKRELITTVIVPNHETVVLGGLITENRTDSRSGIPVLHRIPLIGPLFGTDTKEKDRTELLIFIQPSIVDDPQSLDNAHIDMTSRYKISEDTLKFANGPGVLPPNDTVTTDKGGAPSSTTPAAVPQKKYNAITPPDYDPNSSKYSH
ncbi:hypothetical protein JIN85_10995 [Luteolibacter pohnpeiensis]|uniref:NolW-like domain-containing protein n=1 Tax=Luteolibacter pohnpeiensis TaxID=454153 RepID=A0A934S8S9_9BACT|nr:secretin N-terminal domain-containing protein [Luteolibacter pohnpeiensis]MBK1882946.1 hypothetical protein [Luteolibacter pohnpeiensis]